MSERWWAAPEDRPALEALAPFDVSAWIALASAGTELSGDRQSVAARIETRTGPWLVKWRHTLPARRAKTWGRTGRERAEMRSADAARLLGIPALRVHAVGERRRAGRLVASVLVRPFDLDARPSTEILPGHAEHAARLGRTFAAWHATGWRHGDAWPKNVLAYGDGRRFAPIGHPHAKVVRVGPYDLDDARIRDLAHMTLGLAEFGPDHEALGLDAYAEAAGLTRTSIHRATAARRARIGAKKAERARTRLEREPNGPPRPVPLEKAARRVHILEP